MISKQRENNFLNMLRDAERSANERADGHLTIMKFTTGWKVMLGTPSLTVEFTGQDCEISGGGYGEVGKLPSFDSLEAAVEDFLPVEIPREDKCCEG